MSGGLIETINNFLGGAATTLIGAGAGRLMYHSAEVKSGKRRFFGKELLWEVPIAIGMGIIGEALSGYFSLDQPMQTGLIAMLAYLGPRFAERTFELWVGRGPKG